MIAWSSWCFIVVWCGWKPKSKFSIIEHMRLLKYCTKFDRNRNWGRPESPSASILPDICPAILPFVWFCFSNIHETHAIRSECMRFAYGCFSLQGMVHAGGGGHQFSALCRSFGQVAELALPGLFTTTVNHRKTALISSSSVQENVWFCMIAVQLTTQHKHSKHSKQSIHRKHSKHCIQSKQSKHNYQGKQAE